MQHWCKAFVLDRFFLLSPPTKRYYSTNIFTIIGVAGYISTAIVGVINFLTTFLAIVLVDRVRMYKWHILALVAR